ncbi:MAG: hypothetical protein P8X47_05470 [Ignavibacteriaceae bacterium]
MSQRKQLRVLVARIDRIGDVVLSTPIPREIKNTHPGSFIAVLVKKYTKDIYLNNPHVDKIILYDGEAENEEKSFWQLASYFLAEFLIGLVLGINFISSSVFQSLLIAKNIFL